VRKNFIAEVGVELSATLRLALPICLSQAGQTLLGVIDALMVGHLGAAALAAGSLVNSIVGFVMVFGFGLGTAVAVLVASARAQGRSRQCGEIMRHSLMILGGLGVVFWLALEVGVGFLPQMGQDAAVVVEAEPYLRVIAFSLIPVFLQVGFRQFMEGLMSAVVPALALLVAIVTNVIGNWLLIYGHWGFPEWGLFGAGVATLCARWVMLGVLVAAFFWRKSYRPYAPMAWWRAPDVAVLSDLLRLGVPSGFQYLFEIGAFSLATVMMGWFGAQVQAAHSIALSVGSMTFMVALGTANAASIRVGHCLGQGRRATARSVGYGALGFVVVFMALCGLGIWWMRDVIPLLFISELPVVHMASGMMFFLALMQIVDGFQGVCVGLLRGFQDYFYPTAGTFFAYYVFTIPLCYVLAFPAGWGYQGIWIGLVAGLALISSLLLPRYIYLTWRQGSGPR
jgi:MATE family multidrug resistance protein